MLPELWKNRGSLFGPSVDDLVERFFYGWPGQGESGDVQWSPRVDVLEGEKNVTIDIELPGVAKEDMKIEARDNVLVISGERKRRDDYNSSDCCRSERNYGKFNRSFSLPDTIQADKIEAHFENGVLSLVLPKSEKALPKEISVEVK